jgi:hypothetical protein
MKSQRGYTATELMLLVWLLVCIAGFGGWVANIVKLAGMDFASVTGMLVLRAIGIIVAPLGAVLGFF